MRRKNLTESEKEEIKNSFNLYKQKGITLKDIAKKFNTDFTNIGKIFKKTYGKEYRKISKLKSYEHTLKNDTKKVNELFEKYKEGEEIKNLAKELKIKTQTLKDKFYDRFNKNYIKIRNKRNGKKIPFSKIKMAFSKYKENRVSLAKLAKELGFAESSLTTRFQNHFRKEYKKIAKSRRDERKITNEEYIQAFKEYESTSISLTKIANSLGIRISSLRPKFIRLFGERYHKVAKEKLDGNFLVKRGKIAEKLALEYLKIIGLEIKDIREKPIIKGTLKRPDFIEGENFIEVKSHFVKYSSMRTKGYKEILNSYLHKELLDGGFLSHGIIISLEGFSESVKEQALKDEINLVDYKDLKRKFEEAKRQDLINLMQHHFLPRWVS